MRLTIFNKTGRPDADVHPYVELAASLSSAKGKVELTVYNTRNGRPWGGNCDWNRRVPIITVGVPKDKQAVEVREVTTLGYFRQHGIPLRRPCTTNNWEELLTGIAAHEFAHLYEARTWRAQERLRTVLRRATSSRVGAHADTGRRRVYLETAKRDCGSRTRRLRKRRSAARTPSERSWRQRRSVG